MYSRVRLVLFLIATIGYCEVIHAKGGSKRTGLVPATPPVNVHTTPTSTEYQGFGYLNFNVTLPTKATPEFTVGPLAEDEDATYDTGDVRYSSHGLVYVSEGRLRSNESTEVAWLLGIINTKQIDTEFVKFNTVFDSMYDRSGFYAGKRITKSKRIEQVDFFDMDYSFVSMYATYFLSGNSKIEARGVDTYVSDFDGNSYGVMYRPMLTLQPVFRFSNYVTFIPFAGLSAFISLDYSDWELNEWEDKLYGVDCLDGCPDSDIFFNVIPLETYFGFDIELHFGNENTLSLSSFFSSGLGINSGNMSEIYLVYTRAIN